VTEDHHFDDELMISKTVRAGSFGVFQFNGDKRGHHGLV
jgi:hypothetical protein